MSCVLYTNNEWPKKEIKKSIPFIRVSKRIKYSGINLTKEMKRLLTENYKILWQKIKQTDWKSSGIHSWTGHSWTFIHGLILTCHYYYRQSRFSVIPTKMPIQWHFLQKLHYISIYRNHIHIIEKSIPKFLWNLKGPLTVKTILKKKNGGLTLPDFKTY